jgi:hypothetical protein
VRVARAPGAPEGAPILGLDFAGGGTNVALERAGDSARAAALAPGEYALKVGGAGIASARHSFEVREGEETQLALTLEAGALRHVRVHEGAAGSGQRALRFLIFDALGRQLIDTWELRETEQAWEHARWLAPGEYRVEARLQDGRGTSATLSIAELGAAAEPLELRLE